MLNLEEKKGKSCNLLLVMWPSNEVRKSHSAPRAAYSKAQTLFFSKKRFLLNLFARFSLAKPSINPRSQQLLLYSNVNVMPRFSQAMLCTYQIHLVQNINYHVDARSNIAVCSLQFTKTASAPKKIHVLEINFPPLTPLPFGKSVSWSCFSR